MVPRKQYIRIRIEKVENKIASLEWLGCDIAAQALRDLFYGSISDARIAEKVEARKAFYSKMGA